MSLNFSVRDYLIQLSMTVGGAAVLAIWALVMIYQERRRRKNAAHDTTPPSGVR